MLQCLGSLGLGNAALDARNEVFKNVLLEGTQLRRPLYSGRRNRSTLRNTFFLTKATCSQRTWWGHRERAMSATIVQGKLPKGQFQRRLKTYISGAYRLQEDILKICVSNTHSLFFLTPLGPRVCSRRAHKPNGGRSPGGTGR